MLIEICLKVLICIIYTPKNSLAARKSPPAPCNRRVQLLKRVALSADVLKAEDVENADIMAFRLAPDERTIHTEHNPVEERIVEAFGDRVARVDRLAGVVASYDSVVLEDGAALSERLAQLRGGDVKKLGNNLSYFFRAKNSSSKAHTFISSSLPM